MSFSILISEIMYSIGLCLVLIVLTTVGVILKSKKKKGGVLLYLIGLSIQLISLFGQAKYLFDDRFWRPGIETQVARYFWTLLFFAVAGGIILACVGKNRFVYYCTKCNKIWTFQNADEEKLCPWCNNRLASTEIESREWDRMTADQINKKKNELLAAGNKTETELKSGKSKKKVFQCGICGTYYQTQSEVCPYCHASESIVEKYVDTDAGIPFFEQDPSDAGMIEELAYCRKCGSLLVKGSAFCRKRGTPVFVQESEGIPATEHHKPLTDDLHLRSGNKTTTKTFAAVVQPIEQTTEKEIQFAPDEDEIRFLMDGFSKGFLSRNIATAVSGCIYSFKHQGSTALSHKVLPVLKHAIFQEYGINGAMRYGYILGILQQSGILTETEVKQYNQQMLDFIQEKILAEPEEKPNCLCCGRTFDADMLFCPYCGAALQYNRSNSTQSEWIKNNLQILEKSSAQYIPEVKTNRIHYCYAFSDKKRTITCSKCGRQEVYYYESVSTSDPFDEYIDLCKSIQRLGYKAKLICLCQQCATKEPVHHSQLLFSFFAEGMDQPVVSYPDFGIMGGTKYRLAFDFLNGANTLALLTKTFYKNFSAEAIISMVKEVVWTGSRPHSLSQLQNEMRRQVQDTNPESEERIPKRKESQSHSNNIVEAILDAIEGKDRIDQLAFLSDALDDERISFEEYTALVQLIDEKEKKEKGQSENSNTGEVGSSKEVRLCNLNDALERGLITLDEYRATVIKENL